MRISTLIAIAVLVIPSPASRKTVANANSQIVGTWRLISIEDRSESGIVWHPYGQHPIGLLIYTAAGQMSVQCMKLPSPKVGVAQEKVTTEEKAALFDGYIAYFGRYKVATGTSVIHQVDADLSGEYVGHEELRPFEISSNQLTLRPEWVEDGKRWTGIRVFKRIE